LHPRTGKDTLDGRSSRDTAAELKERSMQKKRYAVVGMGSRGLGMFARPLMTDFSATAELVAVFDINPLRMSSSVSRLPRPVPMYTDFDRMLREANPDAVIVASRDSTHADYVIRTLRAGKRAVSEKPLCTTAAMCRRILAAARKSGAVCLTTHNARYDAAMTSIRSVIGSGSLGRVLQMQFAETLDRLHGADYFRRWHRRKANSGGLQLQKASHHFDLLNWWTGSKPKTVRAQGGLVFYGKNGAFRGKRCKGCRHASKCDFYADFFAHEDYRRMYFEAEPADGYFRDGCVWDPQTDIEDQLHVHITYDSGIQVDYSLVAYSPIESLHVAIEGTKGRLEHETIYNTGWCVGGGNRLPGVENVGGETQRLFLPGQGIAEVPIARPEGEHGGADPQLRRDLFARSWDEPPNDRMASLDQAIQAVLIGAAVNKSLAAGGKPIEVQKLLVRD
jgi:predicted dehydrogenase